MKELICINCPMGCHLKVDDTDKSNIIVTGNTCPRGKTYGINEVLHPLRMVTSLVRVKMEKQMLFLLKLKKLFQRN